MRLRTWSTVPAAMALVAGIAVPARAADGITADLALVSLTADASSVRVHQVVTFTAVAVDRGPDAVVNDSLDIAEAEASGLRPVEYVCSGGISPDGPFCEFGETAVGEQVSVTARYLVTAAAARTGSVRVTFCAQDEAPDYLTDPRPANDCRTLALPVRR